jgi:two-component system, chemotaxis family, chemotaxis protein CheY
MRKILLVDDSRFSRNTVKRALGDEYTYCEADSGTTGLRLFEEENPDLVILDLTMPDLNGLEVLERIKQMDPAARVVINSADIQEFNKTKALELGALAFLNKPVKDEVIRELVARSLNLQRGTP